MNNIWFGVLIIGLSFSVFAQPVTTVSNTNTNSIPNHDNQPYSPKPNLSDEGFLNNREDKEDMRVRHQSELAKIDTLNLSNEQKQAIKKIHDQAQQEIDKDKDSWLLEHNNLISLMPSDKNYEKKLNEDSKMAAKTSEKRIKKIGAIKKEIYNLLNETQKQQVRGEPEILMAMAIIHSTHRDEVVFKNPANPANH